VRARAFLKTLPTPATSTDALESVYSIIKTVSIPRGAHNTSVGLETENNWPTLWTTLADSVNRLYFFQSANSPNLFWLDFSKVNFATGAAVKSVPGNDITMNGEASSKLTVVK
jgi:choloylglycine hydrolase